MGKLVSATRQLRFLQSSRRCGTAVVVFHPPVEYARDSNLSNGRPVIQAVHQNASFKGAQSQYEHVGHRCVPVSVFRHRQHSGSGLLESTNAPLSASFSLKAYSTTSADTSPMQSNQVPQGPLEKILIANRGEIACRVIKTAKRLGIKTVAVFSDADKNAKHVRSADEAVHIGPALARLSYLCAPAILTAARATNAQAIHPGYGFLSENVQFAEMCKDEGFIFMGPPSSAIHAMGDKSVSKKLMSAAGVPVVPGYHGENQSNECLISEANRIGYPVLIKATQGGGGKGMRVVKEESEFLECLSSAQRESLAAFGNSNVLVEKYISEPRHIEVQIFGDKHGNVLHLFERDCSIQRRHQKIIEEAPAPLITEEFRHQIGLAAVNAAKAVGYESAGTVEFIVDRCSGHFYFMEMNTRLQVEHPVTEMVTGQDLVEWQIRVAKGEPLPLQQDQLKLSGHAFEARIYAENVPRGFLPAAGVLHHYHPPLESSTVRVETGVEEGDSVSVYYDPMIAKLVAWGPDRSSALIKLHNCLSKFQVAGVPTNIGFLKAVAKHPAFEAADIETHFIDRFKSELLPGVDGYSTLQAEKDAKAAAAIAAVGICMSTRWSSGVGQLGKGPIGFWNAQSAFRLNHAYSRPIQLYWKPATAEDDSLPIQLLATYHKNDVFKVELQGEKSSELTISDMEFVDGCKDLRLDVGGNSTTVSIAQYWQDGFKNVHLWKGDEHYHFASPLRSFDSEDYEGQITDKSKIEQLYTTKKFGAVMAPMAGRVVKVYVENGTYVKKGEPLLVMEAMKMEHTVRAPVEGIVDGTVVVVGQQVNDNSVLFHIKERAHAVDEDDNVE